MMTSFNDSYDITALFYPAYSPGTFFINRRHKFFLSQKSALGGVTFHHELRLYPRNRLIGRKTLGWIENIVCFGRLFRLRLFRDVHEYFDLLLFTPNTRRHYSFDHIFPSWRWWYRFSFKTKSSISKSDLLVLCYLLNLRGVDGLVFIDCLTDGRSSLLFLYVCMDGFVVIC